MMNHGYAKGRQSGFGIIEVLAAALVLAVGVMSFAALQVRAIQTSGDSYYRTQAMAIAQDLAERVRSNPGQTATFLTSTTWTATVTAPPTTCLTAACTAAQLATFDAQGVIYNAQTLLPQGLVNMQACPGSSVNCIFVSWDGLQPTAGATGQCVTATGSYATPPANMAALPCVMLEML